MRYVFLLLSVLWILPASAQPRVLASTFGNTSTVTAGASNQVVGTLGQTFATSSSRVQSGFWNGPAGRIATSTDPLDGDLPGQYRLDGNYPNPFNPQTTVTYALPEATHVRLVVYNVLGQVVQTLVQTDQAAGTYQILWNGRSDTGASVGSGVYLYRLETDGFTQTRTMLLLK